MATQSIECPPKGDFSRHPKGKGSMKLLHYGLQRSGTNFLESLLKKNYRVQFLNSNKSRSLPLQKHFRLYSKKNIIPEPQYCNNIIVENFENFEALFEVVPDYYLVLSKDPYSWYLSYREWAKKCNWPKVNHHYIEEYNLFYGKFLEFSNQTEKVIFVKYIDLLKDSNAVLNQLQERMNLKKTIISRFILRKPSKVSQSSRFANERRAYYIEEKYLKEYSNEDLQLLNDSLDIEVTGLLGYQSFPDGHERLSES